MTSIFAKKSEKIKHLVKDRILKGKNCLKSSLIMFFNDIWSVIKKVLVLISGNWMLIPNWKSKKKEKKWYNLKYLKRNHINFLSLIWYNLRTILRNFWDYFMVLDLIPHPASLRFFIV